MMANFLTKVHVLFVLATALAALVAVDPVLAQRGGRGGGGFGFDRSSPFGLLRRDDVKQELKLTDAQLDQIEKVQESLQPSEEEQQRNRDRFRQDLSSEERTALFAEMRKEQEAQSETAMTKLKDVLQPAQYDRLEQIRYQELGVQALAREPVSIELKLSDLQKTEVAKLVEEFQSARRDMYRMPREDRGKAEADWNNKFLAVLSPEQKTAWQNLQGRRSEKNKTPPYRKRERTPRQAPPPRPARPAKPTRRPPTTAPWSCRSTAGRPNSPTRPPRRFRKQKSRLRLPKGSRFSSTWKTPLGRWCSSSSPRKPA